MCKCETDSSGEGLPCIINTGNERYAQDVVEDIWAAVSFGGNMTALEQLGLVNEIIQARVGEVRLHQNP